MSDPRRKCLHSDDGPDYFVDSRSSKSLSLRSPGDSTVVGGMLRSLIASVDLIVVDIASISSFSPQIIRLLCRVYVYYTGANRHALLITVYSIEYFASRYKQRCQSGDMRGGLLCRAADKQRARRTMSCVLLLLVFV